MPDQRCPCHCLVETVLDTLTDNPELFRAYMAMAESYFPAYEPAKALGCLIVYTFEDWTNDFDPTHYGERLDVKVHSLIDDLEGSDAIDDKMVEKYRTQAFNHPPYRDALARATGGDLCEYIEFWRDRTQLDDSISSDPETWVADNQGKIAYSVGDMCGEWKEFMEHATDQRPHHSEQWAVRKETIEAVKWQLTSGVNPRNFPQYYVYQKSRYDEALMEYIIQREDFDELKNYLDKLDQLDEDVGDVDELKNYLDKLDQSLDSEQHTDERV